jgi:hypothetical protein
VNYINLAEFCVTLSKPIYHIFVSCILHKQKIKIMKTLQKLLMVIVLISPALFASGQSNTDISQILSKSDSRKKIMDKIANDSTMAKEMKEAMMNSKNGKMMMQGNDKMSMMKTMSDNPDKMDNMMSDMMEKCKTDTLMMKNMMSNMMKACKSDTSMMSSMCKTMMGDQQMKDMMQKKMGGNKDMKKMEGMDKMK